MSFRRMNKLNIVFTLIAIACIVIMFSLGFWQLDRKNQKEQRLVQIEARKDAEPLSLTDIIHVPNDYVDFPVRFSGKLQDELFFIDNRIKNNLVGYEVLAPVSSNYGTVLVNLGWVPGTGIRSELPQIALPDVSTFNGVVYVPSDNRMINETNFNYGSFPVLMQQIDFGEIEQHLGRRVQPFTLRLTYTDDADGASIHKQNGLAASTTFVRDWQVIVMAPEKHLGYAIQWFGLGIAGLTVFLLTVLKSMQKPKDSENGN